MAIPAILARTITASLAGGSISEKALNQLWTWEAIGRIAEKLTPGAAHNVEIVVQGFPNTPNDYLYKQAMGIANGLIANNTLQFNSEHRVSSIIDHRNKIIKVSLAFSASGIYQINSFWNGPNMMAYPIQDPVYLGAYPFMLQIAFATANGFFGFGDPNNYAPPGWTPPGRNGSVIGRDPSSTVVLTSAASDNPSLSNENGTRAPLNTLMRASPLKPTCAAQETPTNEQVNYTNAQQNLIFEKVKALFGLAMPAVGYPKNY